MLGCPRAESSGLSALAYCLARTGGLLMPRTRVLSILSALALLTGATAPVALADPLDQRGGGSHGGHQGTSSGTSWGGGQSTSTGGGWSGSARGDQQAPA